MDRLTVKSFRQSGRVAEPLHSPMVVRDPARLRQMTDHWRRSGQSCGLVATMGALHDGHGALIKAAHRSCDKVMVSIFVNPIQFGPHEDFGAYPRDEASDIAFLAKEKVDVVWIPDDFYPSGFATLIRLDSLSRCLCGASRPHHFPGVATVVARLLLLALPRRAFFGEKDYQQLVIIRALARDLALATEICAVPTIREPDGLALSSRNRYLTVAQRKIAPYLHRTLCRMRARIDQKHPLIDVLDQGQRALKEKGFDAIDYLECRDGDTLSPAGDRFPDRAMPWRLFAAVTLGRARLIDNIALARFDADDPDEYSPGL